MLVWYLQEFPTGPAGTSSQSEQQQRSGPQEGGRSRKEEEEKEEEEESLFKADAVNEEDFERDRATQV